MTTGPPPRSATGRRVILATGLGASLAFLDGTIVHVALPPIAEELSAPFSALQWVVNGYLLVLGALILLGGALGDRFGRRRVFEVGVLGFALASVGCGLAPTHDVLVASRILQGLAAALLIPGSLAILSATFHGPSRGEAIGMWSMLASTATAGGPFLGGWIVDVVSWRWTFLLNLPLAAGVLLLIRTAPETRGAHRRLDVVGSGLAVLSLGTLCFALIEGPVRGFQTPEILAAASTGCVAMVSLALWQSHAPAPMVPQSLWKSRSFLAANALTVLVYFALGGTVFLTAMVLQTGLGFSALRAGLTMLALTIPVALLSQGAGRYAGRHGPRAPLILGPLVCGVGIAGLAGALAAGGELGWVASALVLVGSGLGVVVAPLTTWVFSSVSPSETGVASGVNNSVSRVASLTAVAVLPSLGGLTGADALGSPEFVASLSRGLGFCAGAMWVAVGVALAQAPGVSILVEGEQ